MRREMRSPALTAVFVLAVFLTSSVTARASSSPAYQPKLAIGSPGSNTASPEAIQQGPLLYPEFWVKSGTEMTYSAVFQNLESYTLEVTNIYVDYLEGPGEWLIPGQTSLSIDSGEVVYVDFTFNPGGYINPSPATGVAIEADVMIEAEAMSDPITWFHVRSVVADSVVQVIWDTVWTGLVGLTVATNGNAGDFGAGGVNMDFVGSGLECDPDYAVNAIYLYDLTPIVMTDSETYSWQPYFRPTPADHHFQPVIGYTQPRKVLDAVAERFKTGTFVTSDSTIALEKTWIAPHGDLPFIIEMLKVSSFDGLVHDGVWLGEWADWDIPADIQTYNLGGLATFGETEYLWMQGVTALPEAPCLPYERRFGASAMLGWYYQSDFPVSGPGQTELYSGGLLHWYEFFDETEAQPSPDSVWKLLTTSGFFVHNNYPDKIMFLGYGEFTIKPDDTLYLWTAHVSGYDTDVPGMSTRMQEAQSWYMVNRPLPLAFCCFTTPDGRTGDIDGDREFTLNDITRLIDHVYVSHAPLRCPAAGDTDCDCFINLADITRLIGYIYIEGIPGQPCLCSERPPCPEF